MIDHVNIPCSDLRRSMSFYEPVLSSLGYRKLHVDHDVVGFGTDHWIFGIVHTDKPIIPLHLALKATSRDVVRNFYEAAIDAGGKSNGAPGIRAQYGRDYFAAFVLDPDAHNIEAVCRNL